MSSAQESFFIEGGTVPPESPSYLPRAADGDLYRHASQGDYCYVLSSRQTGKSSLMVRVAERLREDGAAVASVDLSMIGTLQKDPDQWYFGIISAIFDELGVAFDLDPWWREHDRQPPLQKLTDLFRELLVQTTGKVVIFLDEIETTLPLGFTDEFFAAIRACYNARARQPEYRRLTFVLVGVASPSELMQDGRRTPFNVGVHIELRDFSVAECRPWLAVLARHAEDAGAVLEAVFSWTSGHPFLTQKLLRRLVRDGDGHPEERVRQLVEELFLDPAKRRIEPNLGEISRRLLADPTALREQQVKIYRRVLKGRKVPDKAALLPFAKLKLTGLVVTSTAGFLETRNRIYRRAFDETWVRDTMPRRFPAKLAAGVLLALLIITGFIVAKAQVHINQITGAEEVVPYDAYRSLRRIPGFRTNAEDLFATYWDRQSIASENRGEPENALIQQFRALTAQDTEERRKRAFLLKQQFEGLEATVEMPGDEVTAIAPDLSWWVTLDAQNRGWLWRRDASRPVSDLGRITDAVFFARPLRRAEHDRRTAGLFETWLITGTAEGTVGAMQLGVGSKANHAIHQQAVTSLAVSADGEWLATGSEDRSVTVWWLGDGVLKASCLLSLPHRNPIEALAISGNGRWLATRFEDSPSLLLWNLGRRPSPTRRGSECPMVGFSDALPLTGLYRLQHRQNVAAIAFSHDDRRLFVGGDSLLVWDLENLEHEPRDLHREGSPITAMMAAPGRLFVGDLDGTVSAFALDGQAELSQTHLLRGLIGPVDSLAVEPRGRQLAAGSKLGRFTRWTVASEAPRLQASAEITDVAISSDLEQIAAGLIDGGVEHWQPNGQRKEDLSYGVPVSVVVFDPSDRWLASGSTDGKIRLWQPAADLPGPSFIHGDGQPVTALGFDPTGELLASGAWDGTVRLWQIADPAKPELRLEAHRSAVAAVSFSPGGRWLMAASQDSDLVLWDLRSAAAGETPPAHTFRSSSKITVSTLGPADRWLATGNLAGQIELWDLWSSEPTADPLSQDQGDLVTTICFGPRGDRLITGGFEGSIRHWFFSERDGLSADRRDALSSIDWPRGNDAVRAAKLSPDGRLLLIAKDRVVHVFYLPSAEGSSWHQSSFYGRWSSFFRVWDDQVRLAWPFEDTIELETLRILGLRGDPEVLLAEWQDNLGLYLPAGSTDPRPLRSRRTSRSESEAR